jgi:NAD+ diphosphatase
MAAAAAVRFWPILRRAASSQRRARNGDSSMQSGPSASAALSSARAILPRRSIGSAGSAANMAFNYCPSCGSKLSRRSIDGIQRLACESASCGFVNWNNPTPVVAMLVRVDGAYILARHANWPSGVFSLLTGFLEEGESPESAAIREVAEELGLEVRDARFVGHFSFRERNQLIIAFACDCEGSLGLGSEICETRHVLQHELGAYDFGPLRLTRDIVTRWLEMSSQ